MYFFQNKSNNRETRSRPFWIAFSLLLVFILFLIVESGITTGKNSNELLQYSEKEQAASAAIDVEDEITGSPKDPDKIFETSGEKAPAAPTGETPTLSEREENTSANPTDESSRALETEVRERQESLTRGEFAAALAEVLGLEPVDDEELEKSFSDIHESPHRGFIAALAEREILPGYADGSFRPQERVTRAEMAVTLARAAVLDPRTGLPEVFSPHYSDVEESHWGAEGISLATHLGLVGKGEVEGEAEQTFRPAEDVTPQEVRSALFRLLRLESAAGTVTDVNLEDDTLQLAAESGSLDVPLKDESTLIVRNALPADAENLDDGDEVRIFYVEEEPRYIQAYGEISRDDIQSRLRRLLGDAVTPELITALMNRDWDAVRAELAQELHEQLLNMNFSEQEAEALLAQEWDELDQAGRSSIAEALSREFDVSPRLVEALVDGRWSEFWAWLRIEAINRDLVGQASEITGGFLNSSQIVSLLNGDWELAQESLEDELIEELILLGMDPDEAELLVGRRWEELGRHEKERLQQLLASEAGVSVELIEALLSQDWNTVGEEAQVRLVELLIDFLLEDDEHV